MDILKAFPNPVRTFHPSVWFFDLSDQLLENRLSIWHGYSGHLERQEGFYLFNTVFPAWFLSVWAFVKTAKVNRKDSCSTQPDQQHLFLPQLVSAGCFGAFPLPLESGWVFTRAAENNKTFHSRGVVHALQCRWASASGTWLCPGFLVSPEMQSI